MRPIVPKPTERLRAAFRLLTKRGDAAMNCSFCGCNRDQRHRIVAGPGVAICWECARLVNDIAYASAMGQGPAGKKRVTVTPVLKAGEKLDASQWVSLPETLDREATALGCELATWHYTCGHNEVPDHLAFDVLSNSDADEAPLQATLLASCRRALGFQVTAEEAT
jgi:ClpX C4-type zinc finger